MDKWDRRFLEMAFLVGTWSSCFKPERQIGAIIARDKRILTTGYNGAPSGILNCKDRGECMRQRLGIESGTRHEICYAVHSEQNAIIQAAKIGVSVREATLYCTHQPCSICAKMIINSGITRVVFANGYPDDFTIKMFTEANVRFERLSLEDEAK